MEFLDRETEQRIMELMKDGEYTIYDLTEAMKDENAAFSEYESVSDGGSNMNKARIDGTDEWVFVDNYDMVSIESSGSWREYISGWADDLDMSLLQFGLSHLIDYEEAEEDYEGECRIFVKYHYYEGHHNAPKDFWLTNETLTDEIITFPSYSEAKEFVDEQERSDLEPYGVPCLHHGQAATDEYIICKS